MFKQKATAVFGITAGGSRIEQTERLNPQLNKERNFSSGASSEVLAAGLHHPIYIFRS